jgi:NADPH:quinone reductase-like Zn-dependent oxidoreductase
MPTNEGASSATGGAAGATMRAVMHERYGGAEVLSVGRTHVPVPRPGEVLVRVQAVALNPADKFLMLGKPALVRLAMGLARPSRHHRVRGHDFSGTVAALGAGVTRIAVGDAVFGSSDGALAEYVRAKVGVVAHRPASLSVEHAAALPMAGLAALHGLRDAARVQRGEHVLVNGAAGGIGTFAIQIAKSLGADVTAVCSTRNVELVRGLGADHVIDYTQGPLTRSDRRYDVILDNVGNHGLGELLALLTPAGRLLTNSGEAGPDGGPIARMLKAQGRALLGRQRVRSYLSTPNAADLALLAAMAVDGRITPVIDEVFAFERAADAMAHVATRRARGKVVVAVTAS